MERKHTPTPWFLHDRKDHHIITSTAKPKDFYIERIAEIPQWSRGGPGQGRSEAKANAEFIYRACNSFYDLVEALERMAGEYERDHPTAFLFDKNHEGTSLYQSLKALAKAKGEQE